MGPKLPPKKDVLVALLEQSSVFIHLDPRSDEVRVPSWFKQQPELVLQIGLNMPVPIRDLEVDDEAVSCTLSFSRTPHFCFLPWQAIYALVSEDGRGMVWPEDIPPEVAAEKQKKAKKAKKDGKAATARRKLRAVPSEGAKPSAKTARDESAASQTGADEHGEGEADEASPQKPDATPAPEAEAADAPAPEASSAEDSQGNGKPGRRKSLPPYLRVVK